MSQYRLYMKHTCPFCQRVLQFMEANHVNNIELKDIDKNADDKAYLIEKGGKNQVPCLFIDETPMYESMDIIEYIKKNILKGDATEVSDNSNSGGTCPLF